MKVAKSKSKFRPDGSLRPQKWTRPVYPAFDREKFRVLNMIRRLELTDDEVIERMAKGGVTITKATLYNWRLGHKYGGTRYPAGFRLHAMAEALGFPYMPVAVPAGDNSLKNAEVFEDASIHEHKPKRRKAEAEAAVPVHRKAVKAAPAKRRGRPVGSKNKPKAANVVAFKAAAKAIAKAA
jgi:hypothetical protein